MASNPSAFSTVLLAPWLPSDNGLLAAGASLDGAGAVFTPTAGTVYLMKVPARTAYTLSTIWFVVTTAGVGASTGSFVGVYSSAGVLLSGSADIGASLTGTGPVSVALTAAQAQAAGSFAWYAFLCNLATTQPTLRAYAAPSFAVADLNLAAGVARAATNGAGQTALPGSITPSANSLAGNTIWTGGS